MIKIVVFFGLTASGKSTVGQAFARVHGFPYFNTDRVRKELTGLQPTDKRPDGVGQGIYTKTLTRQTYQIMLDRCSDELKHGARGVVLDGSYARRTDRDQVRLTAEFLGADVVFVFCTCTEREVQRRLELRRQDTTAVSDGRMEIYRYQQRSFELPGELAADQLINLNTEDQIDQLLTQLASQPLLVFS